eukprot:GFUD01023414.1.p1 GENE.GFUD01023414.1~~GFUD01023414.1.p1  ORF type:complete len:100 (+),score=30.21 GFUD01023414.1:103-402(+)
MTAEGAQTMEDVLKFLEEELEAFEKLYQELTDRNKRIIAEKETCQLQHPTLIKHKEGPKTLPKPTITKEKPKLLPKPKVYPKAKLIPITYEESELGSEV